MLVMQPNAALIRTSTPDNFINVPMQPRKMDMQYDTVGGRHTNGIQSPLEVHKRCHNGVGVGRWRVDHRSEHHQCLWRVAGALHHWVLLCIEAGPLDRLIVLVDL